MGNCPLFPKALKITGKPVDLEDSETYLITKHSLSNPGKAVTNDGVAVLSEVLRGVEHAPTSRGRSETVI